MTLSRRPADLKSRILTPATVETAAVRGFFYASAVDLDHIWYMARRHANDLGRSVIGKQLSCAMYKACPVAGEVTKFLSVLLRPGQEIKPHSHKRHAMIWYPDGRIKYIAPGTVHDVPRVTVERLSVAMLVSRVVVPRLIPD